MAIEQSNIVRIGKSENTEIYEHAILMRMSPKIYNEYGCILIQTLATRLEFAEVIIKRFRAAGLLEEERNLKKIKVVNGKGKSYVLPNAYEIKLKKIPILEMQGEEE